MQSAPLFAEEFSERSPLATLIVVAAGDTRRRDVLGESLLREGYDVVALETGSQLLQYLYNAVVHQTQPDLVICDALLDGIDGTQVCRISRAQNTLLPFIVLAPHELESMELGDEACVLDADVDLEELKASVFRLAGDP